MPYTITPEAVSTTPLARPVSTPSGGTYVLTRNIPAIQIVPDGERDRLGLITQLPESAELETWGTGFDPQTVKVRCNGVFYFVFVQDLEPVGQLAAPAGC